MMNRKNNKLALAVLVFVSLLLFSFCAGSKVVNSAVMGHWSYAGNTGPAYWHTLDPAYRIAAEGQAQSPININTRALSEMAAPGKPVFHYISTKYELENNGHTIELIPEGEGNYITLDGTDYVLRQFHFHSPGEHQINGETFDLEVHFVHTDREGHNAVAAILFKVGAENSTLGEIFSALEREALPAGASIKMEEPFNPAELFDVLSPVYRYNGSLTTPPCTEGVAWSIASPFRELSKSQLDAFQAVYKGNNRPVQDTHDRTVYRSK
ncbi:carbonic anhydrase family protein [Treponema primitia]|uniref:carbonic anhydrase n=1 Tax=Treponema primitia TaxID=88058 RepID=UPI00398103FD